MMNKLVLCAGMLLFSLSSLHAGRGIITLCNDDSNDRKFQIGEEEKVVMANDCVSIELDYGEHTVRQVDSKEYWHAGAKKFIIEDGKLNEVEAARDWDTFITIENRDQSSHEFEIENQAKDDFLTDNMVQTKSTIDSGETYTFRRALVGETYIVRLVDESEKIKLSKQNSPVVVRYSAETPDEPFSIE